MYSKEESSLWKSRFWTSFGQYMSPVPFSSGEKLNWINYKTGGKHIFFKMHADTEGALVSIDLVHPDEEERFSFFEKFRSLKKMLEDTLEEKWIWEQHAQDINGKYISRIYKALAGVNLFNENDWPAIISFFKLRILKFDKFWEEYQAFILN
ncbi:MAG: DUF4268 domain-containing protein [Ferruginibacter sp.]